MFGNQNLNEDNAAFPFALLSIINLSPAIKFNQQIFDFLCNNINDPNFVSIEIKLATPMELKSNLKTLKNFSNWVAVDDKEKSIRVKQKENWRSVCLDLILNFRHEPLNITAAQVREIHPYRKSYTLFNKQPSLLNFSHLIKLDEKKYLIYCENTQISKSTYNRMKLDLPSAKVTKHGTSVMITGVCEAELELYISSLFRKNGNLQKSYLEDQLQTPQLLLYQDNQLFQTMAEAPDFFTTFTIPLSTSVSSQPLQIATPTNNMNQIQQSPLMLSDSPATTYPDEPKQTKILKLKTIENCIQEIFDYLCSDAIKPNFTNKLINIEFLEKKFDTAANRSILATKIRNNIAKWLKTTLFLKDSMYIEIEHTTNWRLLCINQIIHSGAIEVSQDQVRAIHPERSTYKIVTQTPQDLGFNDFIKLKDERERFLIYFATKENACNHASKIKYILKKELFKEKPGNFVKQYNSRVIITDISENELREVFPVRRTSTNPLFVEQGSNENQDAIENLEPNSHIQIKSTNNQDFSSKESAQSGNDGREILTPQQVDAQSITGYSTSSTPFYANDLTHQNQTVTNSSIFANPFENPAPLEMNTRDENILALESFLFNATKTFVQISNKRLKSNTEEKSEIHKGFSAIKERPTYEEVDQLLIRINELIDERNLPNITNFKPCIEEFLKNKHINSQQQRFISEALSKLELVEKDLNLQQFFHSPRSYF